MHFWRLRGVSMWNQHARSVVEDAVAGVEAGRAGGFGFVIGIDRGGNSLALRAAGADVVVADLAQVTVSTEAPSSWSLVFNRFDPCAGRYSRSSLHTRERLLRHARGGAWNSRRRHSLSGDLPRLRLQPARKPISPVAWSRTKIS